MNSMYALLAVAIDFYWCAGSFRGFVGGLLGKCGKFGEDSLVMDLLHADEES